MNEGKLDIQIQVAADTKGAEQTVAALKGVDATTKQVAATEQSTAEMAKASSADRLAAQQTATAALSRTARERENAAKEESEAGQRASKSISELGKATKELTGVGRDATGVLDGLTRGGLDGLAQAGLNAGKIIRTLASGTLGAVFIPVVAAATGALVILNRQARLNEEAIKKTFESHARASEAYAAKLEEVKKSSEKSLAEMVKQVQELANSYTDLTDKIDAAYKRQTTLTPAKRNVKAAAINADEEEALSKAQTPDEKAKISQNFAAKRLANEVQQKFNDFENIDLQAVVQRDNAKKVKADADNKDAKAADERRKAQQDFDSKQRRTEEFGLPGTETGSSQEAETARKDALAAKEALRQAHQNEKDLRVETDKIRSDADKRISDSKLTVDANALARQQYQEELRGKKATLSQGNPELDKNSKAAADALAATEAAIKNKKEDAFRSGFGAQPDTSDLEKERASQQAILDQAQKEQQTDRNLRQQQNSILERGIQKGKSYRSPYDESDPVGPHDIAPEEKRPGTITSNGKVIPLHGPRQGPGLILDKDGALFNNQLTEPGQGGVRIDRQGENPAAEAEGTSALSELLSANTAALNANTAALKAASGGGLTSGNAAKDTDASVNRISKAGAETGKALDKLHGATVGAISSVAAKADKQAREMEQINRALRVDADRS